MTHKLVSLKSRSLLGLFLVIAAALPAAAQDRPFYVDANVGQTSVDDIEGFPINESTTAFRLGTGYRVLPWLGVAAAFVDLGKIESMVDIGAAMPQRIESSADGFEVTVVGRAPLGDRFTLTAHAGVLWWAGNSSFGSLTSSDSGNDATWGVGAEYAMGPTFTVTAAWRRFMIDNVDADTVWLGLMVRFGDTRR